MYLPGATLPGLHGWQTDEAAAAEKDPASHFEQPADPNRATISIRRADRF